MRNGILVGLACRWGGTGLLALLALCAPLGSAVHGDDEKKDAKEAAKNIIKGKAAQELVDLKREVDALETLFHLEPTEAQLKGLLGLAKQAAARPEPVKEVTATAAYTKALQELRDALAKDDEDAIESLNEKISKLHDEAEIEFDEEFDITDAAIKAAPAAMKLFKARQIVSYLTALDDEVPDPVERILQTISEGEDMAAEDWKSLRDETAEEVGWLVHGFDQDKADKAAKDATTLMDRGHRLKGEELKKEIPVLEQAARKLAGGTGPILVIQHYVERELAEFLSNPRAVDAIKARQENMKK